MILQKATKGTKERGILFRGEMVRAILDGRKTQTRRVGKIQGESYTELGVEYSNHATKGREAVATYRAYPNGGTARWGICACPYGKPGDRLWVRETWAPRDASTIARRDRSEVFYRADDEKRYPDDCAWTPSIHMFRWASRITLEILKVRVERVQDIDWSDAIAEGMRDPYRAAIRSDYQNPESPVAQFRKLWDTMRAGTEFAWDKNPWVWVIEFEFSPF